MLLSSLKTMRGCEGQQEGIYASSDLSRPSRSPPQSDLGLTLLPGLQIQQADDRRHNAVNRGVRRSDQTEPLIGDAKTTFVAEQRATSKSKGPNRRKGSGCSHKLPPGNQRDMSQTLVWIEERQTSLAEKHFQNSKRNKKLLFQSELRQHITGDRFRYGQRVRGCKEAPQDCGDDRSHKKRRVEMTRPASASNNQAVIARASPPSNSAASHNGDRVIPPTREFMQHTTPFAGAKAKILSLSSLTSPYPTFPKRPSLSLEQPSLQAPLPTNLPDNVREQPIASQEIMNISRENAYKQIQAELSQTKSELCTKTRALSGAQHTINDLREASNDLRALTDAHAEFQKAHSTLLLEYGQVLDLYTSLAHKHSSCRGPSSKKLAQRIISSQPPPIDSAYGSRSSSIAAPTPFVPNGGTDTANDCAYHGIPLFDFTTLDLSAPLPSTVTPIEPGDFAPEQNMSNTDRYDTNNTPHDDLDHGNTTGFLPPEQYAPNTDQGDTNDTPHDDANDANNNGGFTTKQNMPNTDQDDANINGFDDEANELFNALWEEEMGNWNGDGPGLEAVM